MVREGYIPYLKEWYKKSLEPKPNQQLQEVDEVHSEIQRLCPGSIPLLATRKHSPITTEQGAFVETRLVSHKDVIHKKIDALKYAEILNKAKSET